MASEKILKAKEQTVSEIKEKIEKNNAVILFDYRGLTVEEISDLRNKLKDSDSEIKVYKNRLTKRALDELNINLDDYMTGPNAIAFSTDIVLPAKVLYEGAKKNDALKIKAGIIEGEIADVDMINKLAVTPSRETLLTMLAAGLLGVVKDLSISLNLYAEQKESGAPVEEKQETAAPEVEAPEEKTEEAATETQEENTESSDSNE